MSLTQLLASSLIGLCVFAQPLTSLARYPGGQDPDPAKEQAALETKALELLDQAIAEGRGLRLAENRARVQFTGGDLLWKRDEKRARVLFGEAAASFAEMLAAIDLKDRRVESQIQAAAQLREEMLMVIARRDAELALDFLRTTRLPATPQNDRAAMRGGRGQNQDVNLEASLLAQIAANDPKLALRLAEEALDKGEYSNRLVQLLSQLYAKDPAAGAKLAEKMVKKLRGENIGTNLGARNLAFSLLNQGPRPAGTNDEQAKVSAVRGQVLDEMAYRELLDAVVTAALSATQTTTRGAPGGGARGGAPAGGGRAAGPSPADRFGQGGRQPLLMTLQSLLPHIDKYMPARAQAVRQKLGDAGVNASGRGAAFGDLNLGSQASVDSIMQAASAAPTEMQGRLYAMAARRALSEGDAERAGKIADEHLSADMRATMVQEVDRQKLVRAAIENKIDEARPALAALRSDEERITVLTQMAAAVSQGGNQKVALQLLDEANALASRRAENYQQLEAQLRVARGYAGVDPGRSFAVLEPGIHQINEMLSAATTLNGFEVRVFKDGEMPLQGGSQLAGMIKSFSRELGFLARSQFDAALGTAERFQRPEARIIARLAIVRGVLEPMTENVRPEPGMRLALPGQRR
jgi:hypothetical protein